MSFPSSPAWIGMAGRALCRISAALCIHDDGIICSGTGFQWIKQMLQDLTCMRNEPGSSSNISSSSKCFSAQTVEEMLRAKLSSYKKPEPPNKCALAHHSPCIAGLNAGTCIQLACDCLNSVGVIPAFQRAS